MDVFAVVRALELAVLLLAWVLQWASILWLVFRWLLHVGLLRILGAQLDAEVEGAWALPPNSDLQLAVLLGGVLLTSAKGWNHYSKDHQRFERYVSALDLDVPCFVFLEGRSYVRSGHAPNFVEARKRNALWRSMPAAVMGLLVVVLGRASAAVCEAKWQVDVQFDQSWDEKFGQRFNVSMHNGYASSTWVPDVDDDYAVLEDVLAPAWRAFSTKTPHCVNQDYIELKRLSKSEQFNRVVQSSPGASLEDMTPGVGYGATARAVIPWLADVLTLECLDGLGLPRVLAGAHHVQDYVRSSAICRVNKIVSHNVRTLVYADPRAQMPLLRASFQLLSATNGIYKITTQWAHTSGLDIGASFRVVLFLHTLLEAAFTATGIVVGLTVFPLAGMWRSIEHALQGAVRQVMPQVHRLFGALLGAIVTGAQFDVNEAIGMLDTFGRDNARELFAELLRNAWSPLEVLVNPPAAVTGQRVAILVASAVCILCVARWSCPPDIDVDHAVVTSPVIHAGGAGRPPSWSLVLRLLFFKVSVVYGIFVISWWQWAQFRMSVSLVFKIVLPEHAAPFVAPFTILPTVILMSGAWLALRLYSADVEGGVAGAVSELARLPLPMCSSCSRARKPAGRGPPAQQGAAGYGAFAGQPGASWQQLREQHHSSVGQQHVPQQHGNFQHHVFSANPQQQGHLQHQGHQHLPQGHGHFQRHVFHANL